MEPPQQNRQQPENLRRQYPQQAALESPPVTTGEPEVQRLRSNASVIGLGLVMTLSVVIYGYGLKSMTSIPIERIVEMYNITIGESAALGILIGIVPFGSVFGCILTTKIMFKYTRRLTGIYIFTIVSLISTGLVNITTFPTLLLSRFIEGISAGFYTSITPIYLRQIAPKELRHTLGAFSSLGQVFGVLFAIALELSLTGHVPYDWRIIFSTAGILSVIQAVLLGIFGSATPTELMESDDMQQARQVINRFYKEEFQEEIYEEYLKEDQMAKGLVKNSFEQENQRQEVVELPSVLLDLDSKRKLESEVEIKNLGELHLSKRDTNVSLESSSSNIVLPVESTQEDSVQSFEEKKCIAYGMALHLGILTGTVGGHVVLIQGGLFIGNFDEKLGRFSSLILNLVQFASIVIGLAFVYDHVGKRKLFLFSLSFLPVCGIALAISMINKDMVASLVFMCFFMAGYGSSFISPVWVYPPAVVPAKNMLGIYCAEWLSISLTSFVAPVVAGAMPDNNPYPVFFFFALCGLICFAHSYFKLKESDGKTYDEIIRSYE